MPIWTSPSRIRSAVGRLTRSHSSRRGSSRLCLLLRLRRQLRLHRRVNLPHRVRHHCKLRLHLQLGPKLNLQLHRELEGKRESPTATSGRANPDKSVTTSPWFRDGRTIRFWQETLG